MKTYIADIIPKIKKFSQKLDNLTKLTNQRWVSLGDITEVKRVFIFRPNNQLLISNNGIVEKCSWEYLDEQSLLIDTKTDCYLLKHGFFDENVIALKLDRTEGYAFFVNESKYRSELNNIHDVRKFLENTYLKKEGIPNEIKPKMKSLTENIFGDFDTDKGVIKVKLHFKGAVPAMNNEVYQNSKPALNGKYKLGFMNYIVVKDGVIIDMTMF